MLPVAKKHEPDLTDGTGGDQSPADSTPPKKKRTMDPDLHLLARFDRQLGSLDELARTRIMSWLVVKYLPSVTITKPAAS